MIPPNPSYTKLRSDIQLSQVDTETGRTARTQETCPKNKFMRKKTVENTTWKETGVRQKKLVFDRTWKAKGKM